MSSYRTLTKPGVNKGFENETKPFQTAAIKVTVHNNQCDDKLLILTIVNVRVCEFVCFNHATTTKPN